jgi:uncharacterized protein (TIGR03118 family)
MTGWLRSMRRGVRASRRECRTSSSALGVERLEDRCLLTVAYLQTNLVSDIPGIARFTDPNLVNPWGLAYGPTGPFWVSDNNAAVSTLYTGNGQPQSLVVGIPGPDGTPTSGTPTGIVFNGGSGFTVTDGTHSGTAFFIFATEDGTIAGWAPAVSFTQAELAVPNPGGTAVYKGLAMGVNSTGNTLLYATNFRAGTIDVFDTSFRNVDSVITFHDPHIPVGYAPFGIQNIGGQLFVTYAKQDAAKHDDDAGPGRGFVDVFTTDGVLVRRFASHGPLNSPWGMALAPSNFGPFSGDLLIGNFGNGRINAFDPTTGAFLGALKDGNGNPIVIGGLWGLMFGNGAKAGSKHTLFFSAGINHEGDGLFGSLQAKDISPAGSAPNPGGTTLLSLAHGGSDANSSQIVAPGHGTGTNQGMLAILSVGSHASALPGPEQGNITASALSHQQAHDTVFAPTGLDALGAASVDILARSLLA